MAWQGRRARWRLHSVWLLSALLLVVGVGQHSFAQPNQPKPGNSGVQVIVLDPGHGGSDDGARGPTGLLEKHVTLQVAQEAMRLIEQYLRLRVVLTRTDDSAVPLEMRASLANQAGGDLFISIHASGSFSQEPRGFQTFYLDAPQEAPLPLRDDPRARGEPPRRGQAQRGTAPPLRSIVWEQAQVEFLDMSQVLARSLQKNLRAQLGDEEREAQGLPLLMLRWIRMPAALVDLGSLSDPAFEGKLRDEAYVQRAALGIAQAVNDYQDLYR